MHETLSVNASLLTLYIMHGNRDRGPYRIEISPLICWANQWTGFYMIILFIRKSARILC